MQQHRLNEKRKPSKDQSRLYFIAPWAVCILVAVFYWYDYLLRVMPGILITPFMRDFHIDAFRIGLLAAAYFYAYTPLQLVAGALVDKYSRRWVLFISCMISALGGIVFSLSSNYYWIIAGRNLMGIGSAFAFVGALKLAAMRLPHRYFVMFVGIMLSLGILGALTTDILVAPSVASYGWRATALSVGLIGVALAILMLVFAKERPDWLPKYPSTKNSMWSFIAHAIGQFKHFHIWCIGLLGGFIMLPISVFASLWYTLFLKQAYNITNINATQTTSLIFLGFIIGAPFFAWCSNAIRKRKPLLVLGAVAIFILSAIIIYAPIFSHDIFLGLLFLLGFFTATQVLLFGVVKELSMPRFTGVAMASVNFLMSLSPLVFQPWIGLWLSAHWQGKLSPSGTPIYSQLNYDHAFVALLFMLFIAILLVCYIPETRCQMRAQVEATPSPTFIGK